MRRWIPILAAMLLSACSNQVLSDVPLIVAGEQPAEVVRVGRWVMLEDSCGDVAPPVAWTDCGEQALFDGALVAFEDQTAIPLRIGAGAPIVLQARQTGDRLIGRSLNDFALRQRGKLPPLTGPQPPYFLYYIVEPVRRDAEGRIVDLRLREVQCGPPRAPIEPTDRPGPGLTMDEEDNNCLAADRVALSGAARATRDRPYDRTEGRYVWVADLSQQDRARIAQSTIAE
jgi:hypothetical protein